MTSQEFIQHLQPLQESFRRFLLALCDGDRFTADDIAQDALLRAWMGMDRYRGEAKFSTWLFKIGYNCWLDRHYQRHTERITEGAFEVEVHTGDPFRYQDLYQAISELNTQERAAILLFYMEDKSIKDIATILDIKTGTVKSLLSRGRSKLKIKLQDER